MSIGGNVLTNAESAELRIVVHRADGRVEDLGTVAYWHKNPLKRWAWKIKHFLAKLR